MGDSSQTVVAGGVGTAFTLVLFVVYKFVVPFFTAANHKRIRSVCCGLGCTTSMDVEDTTPTVVVLRNPLESGSVVGASGVGPSGSVH
jgi:hypothetical protein